MLLKTSDGCLFTNSESGRPMTQVLFDPGCAPALDNLGGAIPCWSTQLRSRYGGFVDVGECQCRSACRVRNSASNNRIPSEQSREPWTRKRQRIKITSYPLLNKVTCCGLACSLSALFTAGSKCVTLLYMESSEKHWYAFRDRVPQDSSSVVVIGM